VLTRFRHASAKIRRLFSLESEIETIKMLQGRLLCLQHENRTGEFSSYEFSVFSQWGEDGIIQFLTSRLDIRNKTFIEFGVEDFAESNCRFLLMKDNWRGFVIDGSEKNVEKLKKTALYWRHALEARAAFITRENIDLLLQESSFDPELGILSIDIDGVDYYILEALHGWRPSILIVEYNAVFGKDRAVTVPYDSQFVRSQKHFSNLYAGASLPAFVHIADQRGYGLVGVNQAGNNAFFVRRDLLNAAVTEVDVSKAFRDSSFKESRDSDGNLTLLAGDRRRGQIADLRLIDVLTGESLFVRNLDQ